MAQHCGFFTALPTEDGYDRTYSAEDYRNNLAVIISDGVLRSTADDLKPTANGMGVNIGVGKAWIRGAWYSNDTVYGLVTPTASTTNPRIDRVVLRFNDSLAVRDVALEYVAGTPAAVPVAPAPLDTSAIKDLVLCDVYVPANATAVTITDQRANADLCGWVYSVSGDNAFFETLDNNFDEWFGNTRNTLASVTLFKQYTWRGLTENADQSVVTFNIPQYDPTGVDIIQVYFNGLLQAPTVDYTLSGSNITFTAAKSAGQEVFVVCYKSIDGTGLGSVSDEIAELQTQVANLADFTDYNYICTGNNDNIALSTIAQTFLNGSTTDGARLTIRVYGTLGVTSPNAGAGTSADPYQWFSFGQDASTNRKIIFDFENCNRFKITVSANKYNTIFYGSDVFLRNVSVDVEQPTSTTGGVWCINSTTGKVQCNGCSFVMSGSLNCVIANGGTFNDCYGNVTNTSNHSFCLYGYTDSLLRVNGGEWYAYAPTGYISACVFVSTNSENSAVKCNALNCPINARTGLQQGYAIRDLSLNGNNTYSDIITPLVVQGQSQLITGTAAVNKFNRT